MNRISTKICFVFLLFVVGTLTAQDLKIEARNKEIDSRADEVVEFLSKAPRCAGRHVTDRTSWDALAKERGFRNVIRDAENALKTTIPELPESLYKEFYQNGNRSRYQNERSKKYRRIDIFTLAECIENKGRFIAPLEETVRSVCADPSWVLPAHDSEAGIFDGKFNYIDLTSADTSAELALADYWLGDKLSPEIRKLIRDNVQRRTFASYERSVKEPSTKTGRGNGWITTTNNWNAVCHADVVCAALCLIDDPVRRAWYIAAAEKFMEPFFRGFTPDGYCSEGMGYWNYGYGHFIELAEIVWQATDGKVDFMTMPKVRNCSLFGPRMEIAPNIFAAFADCPISAKPTPRFVQYLSLRLGFGFEDYEKTPLGSANLKSVGVHCFSNSATKTPPTKASTTPLAELRTDFPDAGILICRPKTDQARQLALACKGGHNAEHHNHNDIGAYTIVFAGTMPLLDPGGEVYTRRTFSGKRYDSKLLNSYGHPVPVINNQLQQTGRKAEGKVLEKIFTNEKDVFTIDYASAYPVKEITKLYRTFEFTRAETGKPNSVTVTDEIILSKPGSFESALLTYEKWKKKDDDPKDDRIELVIGENDKAIRVTITAVVNDKPASMEFSTEEIDEDAMARKKPTRFSFKIKGDVSEAKVVTVTTPAD